MRAALVGTVVLVIAASMGFGTPSFAEDSPGRILATNIAKAAGADAWAGLSRVRFTWTHTGRQIARSYDWNLKTGQVAVTMDGLTVTVPAIRTGDADKWTPDMEKAHQAYINDVYWFMFELRAAGDTGTTLTDLGEVDVPMLPGVGKVRGLRVQYGSTGGYTPGDTYVLYVDATFRSVAWSYTPAGALDPKMTVARTEHTDMKGIHLPTKFVNAQGQAIITITDVAIE